MIKKVIGGAQRTVAIDEGGLDNVNDNIEALVNAYGSKNLNAYPYYETTKAENGLTFTVNGDGSITVSGTASATTKFRCHYADVSDFKLGAGEYVLSGCPSGGSLDTYRLFCQDANDIGNGSTFTLSGETSVGIGITIVSGTVISTPLTFKPMIRDARITDNTYVPYAMTNNELTERVAANNAGTSVNITTYNSASNKYTFPSDGYMALYSGSTSSGFMSANLYGANDQAISTFYMDIAHQYQSLPTFVKKGMKAYLNDTVTNGQFRFYPLEY